MPIIKVAQGQDLHPTVGYDLEGRSLPCILLDSCLVTVLSGYQTKTNQQTNNRCQFVCILW